MKQRAFISLVCGLLVFLACSAADNSLIETTITTASSIKQQQHSALRSFRNGYIPRHPHSLRAIVDFFSLEDAYPLIKDNQVLLEKAITYFKHVKGFGPLFTQLLKNMSCPSVKGYVYELQRAVSIHEKHPEDPIIALGSIKYIELEDGTVLQREFDIETVHYCIECKCRNIRNPPQTPQSPTKVGKKLLEQKQIISYLNAHAPYHRIFQLSTFNALPEEWHVWLDEHEIDLHEGI